MRIVEIFADVTCPFTHAGLRRFVDRVTAGPAEVTIRVRAWPLELINGEPAPAAMVAEEIAALRAEVAPDLFSGFDAAAWPSTSLPALAFAAAAARVDDATGLRAALAVREALFERGEDISDPAVLGALGDRLGVRPGPDDDAAVLADWHEGQARGVQGSPYFFVDGDGYFCPMLRVEHTDGRYVVHPQPEAFDALVARCLA